LIVTFADVVPPLAVAAAVTWRPLLRVYRKLLASPLLVNVNVAGCPTPPETGHESGSSGVAHPAYVVDVAVGDTGAVVSISK
jgi:hypothetical protein